MTPPLSAPSRTSPKRPEPASRPRGLGVGARDGVLRAAVAVAGGYGLTLLLGLIIWAITPSSGSTPEPLLRGATAAFVLAHFGHLSIGNAELTLTPLLLTLVFGLILAVGAGRRRLIDASAQDEAWSIGAGAVTYGLLVALVAVMFAPAGAKEPVVGLWAAGLAAMSLGIGMLWRGQALRELIGGRLAPWVLVGLRAAAAAVGVLAAGAALVVAVALVGSFSRAAELTGAMANGVGEGLGLTLAAAGFLPNMVIAAVGYVTGGGFQVGSGSYSPFGSVLADLPPFPPLAAVPTTSAASVIGLSLLLIPVGAGLVSGMVVMRRLSERTERLRAVAVSGGLAGFSLGLVVWVGSGGVVGGAWPQIGARGWLVGLLTAAFVLVVAGAWVFGADLGGSAVAVYLTSGRGRRGRRVSAPADGTADDVDHNGIEVPDIEAPDSEESGVDSADAEDIDANGDTDRTPGSDGDSDNDGAQSSDAENAADADAQDDDAAEDLDEDLGDEIAADADADADTDTVTDTEPEDANRTADAVPESDVTEHTEVTDSVGPAATEPAARALESDDESSPRE